MKFAQLVHRFFLSLLICQLVLVSPSLPNFEYSKGSMAQVVRDQVTSSPRLPLTSATYVASQDPYDSLIFVGDVLLARNIEFLLNTQGADYPYAGLSFNALAQRPAVVGNFEASIPKVHQPTPEKMMRFSVSARYIPQLAWAGFTHLSLSNNHALDFSDAGYNNTKRVLDQNQLASFGHPKQFDANAVEFIETQDKVVAVIAAHTLQQLPAYSEIKDVFAYASARSDFQIVYVHWGTEYAPVHNTRQREAAERFVEAGADVVIGHHPHVVQDIELINGVPVFYSLGNYIFDQYDEVNTQEGLMLHLGLANGQSQISLLPVTSVGTLSQPRFMQAASHASFLEKVADKSDPELREYIRRGQILLDVQVASSSKVAMISQ